MPIERSHPTDTFCAQLAAVWEQTTALFALLDPAGHILRSNPAFHRWMESGEAELQGLQIRGCLLEALDEDAEARLLAALNQASAGEAAALELAGRPPLHVSIEPLHRVDAVPTMLLLHAHDISAHVSARQALERMAHYDPLTGLPNRALFGDRLRLALSRARREGTLVAVCYLDLDGFKAVNDRLGHDAGDRLLIEVAARLKDSVRGGDTIARLGGDEFILIIENIASPAELDTAMQRVLVALACPAVIDGQAAQVSASIGIALFPLDSEDEDVLIRYADQAMYSAKQAGKNRYHLFDRSDAALLSSHRDLKQGIEQALLRGEFELLYQPKVSLRSGRVVGVEALLRWRHPQRGLLAPADFLDALESSDLAIEVDRWLLVAGARQAEAWYRQGLDLVVSLNVSPHHLDHPDFVHDLSRALVAAPQLPPDRLELEIAEQAIHHPHQVGAVMKACERLGVRFAIDDFGTGKSSLGTVSQLPARTLKIDRRFIADMLNNPEDFAIIDGIIGLTSAFRRDVIAEGLETPEHGALLLQLGCEIAQGYGIAPPMPATALPDWVRGFRPDPTWREASSTQLPHDDLPMLKIEIDLRTWRRKLRTALDSKIQGETLEVPDCPSPHFGPWVESAGMERFGNEPAFQEACRAYAQLLEQVRALRNQDSNASRARLDLCWQSVQAASDQLLACLGRLKALARAEAPCYPWVSDGMTLI